MENGLHVSPENLLLPQSLFWHLQLGISAKSPLHVKPCLKQAAEEPSIEFNQIEIKNKKTELKMKTRGNLNILQSSQVVQ